MRFESWEEKAYNELLEKYNDFFEELRKKSIECFKIDAHEIFKCSNELTAEQEKIIKDFWKKYIDDYEINYIKYYVDRTGFFDKRFIPDDVFVGYIDPYLNNRQIEPGVADKNYFDLYLKGFKMPKTYIHYINGIYEDENYSNAVSMAFLAAAAMKTGCAKKLTNILTGDIINIEIKKYGEEIDEEL